MATMTMTPEEVARRLSMMRKHLEVLQHLHASPTVLDSAQQALEALERCKREFEPSNNAATDAKGALRRL